jgi:hypothetical protein
MEVPPMLVLYEFNKGWGEMKTVFLGKENQEINFSGEMGIPGNRNFITVRPESVEGRTAGTQTSLPRVPKPAGGWFLHSVRRCG